MCNLRIQRENKKQSQKKYNWVKKDNTKITVIIEVEDKEKIEGQETAQFLRKTMKIPKT